MGLLHAQRPEATFPPDSVARDTSLLALDTLRNDSVVEVVASFKMSKDSLEAAVEYSAEDSMRIDVQGERIHLYGKAKVIYETITLEAGHIELN